MKRLMFLFTINLLCHTLQAGPAVSLHTANPYQPAGRQIVVRAVITDVENLDTYSLKVAWDSALLRLDHAAIEDALSGQLNVLRRGSGEIIPLVKKDSATVHLSATLTGEVPMGPVSDEGLLGLLLFTVLDDGPAELTVEECELLDNKRKPIPDAAAAGLIINGEDGQ